MDQIYKWLAQRALDASERTQSKYKRHALVLFNVNAPANVQPTTIRKACLVCRLIVGIAGIPGSGKSTLTAAVAARINAMRPRLDGKQVAVAIGMDGERAPLSQMHAGAALS